MAREKLLVIQVAALGMRQAGMLSESVRRSLNFQPMQTIFPAVTCTAQASFRTGLLPVEHGVMANGFYDRILNKALFWEQSSAIVRGRRFWEESRSAGEKKVAMLFWQESLGECVDVLLSPAPIHKHGGGLVQAVYSQPADLYERLCAKIGRKLRLEHYWGPLASHKSSEWIAEATAALLGMSDCAPDLCMTYLPVLDYDLQRWGPNSKQAVVAIDRLSAQLDLVLRSCADNGYRAVVFGDYAIGEVSGALFPNKALLEAGLMKTREVNNRLYPDMNTSMAFCLADHEVGLVYAKTQEAVEKAGEVLSAMAGIEKVIPAEELSKGVLFHSAPDLVVLAEEGRWIAYPWWDNNRRAPDYARHVDIHNKPGYDPCELFFGFPPGTSLDTGRIKGSHGRVGPGREACFGATFDTGLKDATLTDLASNVAEKFDGRVK